MRKLDGKGAHKRAEGDVTRRKILDYVARRPHARVREIADAIGIHRTTVFRHVKAIRQSENYDG